ncbi:unnamed protein product [Orchesella dallaii]|uniref:DUF4789 domain-containing protein n=1 Tax=Orchesella dallaii TaxID=48710 RepID=A0ABP1Q6W8_9HEXA
MISKYFSSNIILISTIFLLVVKVGSISKKPVAVVKERIITDIKDVRNGVKIDYSYNESVTIVDLSTSREGLASVPGCPKSDEGYPWVYFGSPPKCYLTGQRGPCEGDQSLFIKKGTPFGFCNCDCFQDQESRGKEKKDQDRFCTARLEEFVYMPALEKCFTLYDQGPCKTDEWLVKVSKGVNNTNAIAKCETRKCPKGQVPHGEDKDGKTSCSGRFSVYASPVSIPRNECEDRGMRYSELLKKCVKKYSLSFV